ncbi:MAG: calcium-binding protein [Sphingomonadales bacterium]|nr:MAG: calcium-binding protein [Sphingomonadales bacterium]
MLKNILLASSMMIAVPAFAQDTKPAQPAPPTQDAAPMTADTTTAAPVADDAAPAQTAEQTAMPATTPQTAPAQTAATPQASPAPGAEAAQPAQTAAVEPVKPSQEQIAQAVGRDWAGYDADKNDQLSAAEFGNWMSTLRKASEPSFTPGSPEAKAWETQAFTAADADKSASVNKQELTSFLMPKAS